MKELLKGIFVIIVFVIIMTCMIGLGMWGSTKIEVEQPKKCIEFSDERQVWVAGESFNVPMWLATDNIGVGIATAKKGHYVTKRDCLKWE